MIGLGVAVPRFVSLYPERHSNLSSALVLIFFSFLVFGAIIIVNKVYFAQLFFGGEQYSKYIIPLFLLLAGYCFHALLFGFLRGKHFVYFPNIIQLINIGLLPILIILNISNILTILYLNGSILLFNSLVLSLFLLSKYGSAFQSKKFLADVKTLLNYGLPRVLGDFSLLLLITLPSYLVLYIQNDILLSGDVAYSLTLLNLVGAAFGPLGLVLLPEIADFMNKKQYTYIKKRFVAFCAVGLSLTLIGYLIYFFFSESILKLLLGNDYRESVNYLSLIVLKASFGYALYIILRSFLDAIKVKAVNSFNLIFSLCLYALLLVLVYIQQGSIESYLNAFVISITFLGLVTLVQTYRLVKSL